MNIPQLVCVAGGTGGHINAALAIGNKAELKGFEVTYVSGDRPLDFRLFPKNKTRNLSARPLRKKNPLSLLIALVLNFLVYVQSLILFIANRPKTIIGTGGYICGPVMLAGKTLGIDLFILEQNAVLGMTNRFLAKISTKIFLHFEETKGLREKDKKRSAVVGNPTLLKNTPTPQNSSHPFQVLVFGGSLGAQQINELMSALIQRHFSFPIHFVHQTGPISLEVGPLGKNVSYEQFPYISNMESYYNRCHFIIARAGASSVAEIAQMKRPCLLIPYPAATDNHQFFNASELKKSADFSVTIIEYKTVDWEILDDCVSLLERIYSQRSLSKKTPGNTAVDSNNQILSAADKMIAEVSL